MFALLHECRPQDLGIYILIFLFMYLFIWSSKSCNAKRGDSHGELSGLEHEALYSVNRDITEIPLACSTPGSQVSERDGFAKLIRRLCMRESSSVDLEFQSM